MVANSLAIVSPEAIDFVWSHLGESSFISTRKLYSPVFYVCEFIEKAYFWLHFGCGFGHSSGFYQERNKSEVNQTVD